MDTQRDAAEVDRQLKEIKDHMPETYKAITEKAGVIGRQAYAFVRQGAGGQANKFYALECGRVVGTPFDLPGVADEVARVVVQFGVTFLLMWAPEAQAAAKEADHGAH